MKMALLIDLRRFHVRLVEVFSPEQPLDSSQPLTSDARTGDHWSRGTVLAFVVLLFGLARVGSAAEADGLNESARAQIQAVMEEKASWTPAQRKLDSHLVHAVKKSRGQPFAPKASKLQLSLSAQRTPLAQVFRKTSEPTTR